MKDMWKGILGIDIPTPFPRMEYDLAMRDYGVDKPDTRFELKLCELNDVFAGSDFNVFKGALQTQGLIKGMVVKGKAETFSRKDFDDYTKFVGTYGAKGMLWFKFAADGAISGPAVKFLKPEEIERMKKVTGAGAGDAVFMVADSARVANDAMGSLRLKIGEKLGLIDKTKFNFLWVTNFPLLTYEPSDGRWYACHHPFTSPQPKDTSSSRAKTWARSRPQPTISCSTAPNSPGAACEFTTRKSRPRCSRRWA